MRLIPKSTMYGVPARMLRDFLRTVSVGTFDEDYLRSWLELDAVESKNVLAAMLFDDLIDSALPVNGVPRYGLLAKGCQIAAAKFASPIARPVAEQLLAGVIARAADSTVHPFAYRVVNVALFGSMLGSASIVSDVDLAVALKPRFDGARHDEVNRARIEAAEQAGRVFRTTFESVVWPRMEVIEFLRGGSRFVSIHSFGELELLGCPFALVYEADLKLRGND